MEEIPLTTVGELAAAFLQAAVTLGLAGLFLFLHVRYRKPHFGWFALAWLLYVLRLAAIISFLLSRNWFWLYWHQVTTGWTALALLWAAVVFSQQRKWRPIYLSAAAFPPVWSYIAIYQMDSFMLAAAPAVAFLSGATLWTGWAFLQYHRRVRSAVALGLAVALFLWGAHHLDYPFLRARGAWNPWGYYLDLVFVLAMGVGALLLMLEDLNRGLAARTAELERLATRTVRRHEDERRRLARELHDEAAQLITAVKLELGLVREGATTEQKPRLDRAIDLIATGMRSIRDVTDDLRPSLLDELGLVPAMRALVTDLASRSHTAIAFDAEESLPPLGPDAELALFRALQEALANVARHADAAGVNVCLAVDSDHNVELSVVDDGRGMPAGGTSQAEGQGRMGLLGMRERIVGLGGRVMVGAAPSGGVRLVVTVPSGSAG
jgi:signal transduction histidine kinase